MKILGTNFFGHDSAICFIDTSSRKIFAISSERITRIKHDPIDISSTLNSIEDSQIDLKNIDYIAQGYEEYSWAKPFYYDILSIKRKIFNPRYLSDIINYKKKKYS